MYVPGATEAVILVQKLRRQWPIRRNPETATDHDLSLDPTRRRCPDLRLQQDQNHPQPPFTRTK